MAEYSTGLQGSIVVERLNAVPNKVDKIEGKGLSTNDYTNNDKAKVGEIDTKAPMFQMVSMPTASVTFLDKIYQYIGPTDINYVNGNWYKCVSDGGATPVYTWVQIGGNDSTMVVNFTISGQSATADKTVAEIVSAISDGKVVLGKFSKQQGIVTITVILSSESILSNGSAAIINFVGSYESLVFKIISQGVSWVYSEQSVVFTGATSSNNGEKGLVPAPSKGQQNRYLSGNGTWKTLPKYNGSEMTSATDIPQVKTSEWDGKYTKPSDGVPETDLDSQLQGKIATFITSSVSNLANYRKSADQDVIDASKESKVTRETISVAAGASSVYVPLEPGKVKLVDLTGAGSAVTLTFYASKTGWDLTKENELRAKVKVPSSGVAVTFAWDSVTSGGTLSWGDGAAPGFTAAKTTEVNIDLAIGDSNFEGVYVEF